MWLTAIDGLYVRRAPGLSCLKGLKALSEGEKVKSESQKGCGGVMRVAPIGLFMAAREEYTIEDATNLGAAAAKITHKGQLGFLPAALLANIIYRLTLISTEEASQNLGQIIRDAMTQLSAVIDKESGKSFGKLYSSKIRAMNGLIDLAFDYSTSELSDFEAISRIGHGKLGNEAIAIAIYCCLRYPSDFERCIIASVNHSGDCDSTGAVTGNIIGAALGWSQIPSHFAERLELLDTLEMIASDLASLEIDSNRYTKK